MPLKGKSQAESVLDFSKVRTVKDISKKFRKVIRAVDQLKKLFDTKCVEALGIATEALRIVTEAKSMAYYCMTVMKVLKEKGLYNEKEIEDYIKAVKSNSNKETVPGVPVQSKEAGSDGSSVEPRK